jgi:ATP-dependent exoDNAse (exonuclease V) beta subunit
VTTKYPQIDDEKTKHSRGADLETLVAKTRQLAAKGAGELPRGSEPIPVDAASRRRFSFSQLTGALAFQPEDETALDGDAAASLERVTLEGGRDSRELGSLVHAVLERIDFQRPQPVDNLCKSLASLAPDQPKEETVARAAALIERFLASPRAAELARAKVVRREVEFLLPWPPADAGPTLRYFHGYIDCLYQGADGRWRLLDFKTNRATPENLAAVANQYELQLLVYFLAMEEALGEPPAEVVLSLLDDGGERRFNWNDQDRRNGVQQIDAAMKHLLSALIQIS